MRKRESLTTWKGLFKRALCAFIFRGHKFPENLGKRSDLRCLRCDEMFFTKKNYKKGKGNRRF